HEQLEHQRAAAAVDDVLRLDVVAVHRGHLVSPGDHDLLGIKLAAPLGEVADDAAPDPEKEQPQPVELSLAVIPDFPPEPGFQNGAGLALPLLELIDAPIGEGRQEVAERADEIVRLLHDLIDFGTLHSLLPTGFPVSDARGRARTQTLASLRGNGNMLAGRRD